MTAEEAFKLFCDNSERMEVESPSLVGLLTSTTNRLNPAKEEIKTRTPTPNEEMSASPKIRSLSMSTNLAFSVLDEVSHMIRPSTSSSPKRTSCEDFPAYSEIPIKRSSSASSLTRLQSQSQSQNQSSSTTPPALASLSNSSSTPRAVDGSSSSEGQEDDLVLENEIDPDPETEPASMSISLEAGPFSNVLSSVGKSTSSSSNSSNLCRSEVLIGIVVSRWDNIVGPQCIYLWTEERTSTFYPARLPNPLVRHVKYVTDHTVDHQDVDGNLVSPSTTRSALCVVHDLDLAYLSVSIRVPSADSLNSGPEGSSAQNTPWGSDLDYSASGDRPAVTVPHAVAVLAKLKFLKHFLLMRPLISNWLAEFSPKIGVLLCKNQLQSSMVNSWCAELCKTMTAIWNCWWEQQRFALSTKENTSIPTPSTSTAATATATLVEPEIRPRSAVSLFKRKVSKDSQQKANKLDDQWDYLPPSFSGKLSLETMVTSHLSTGGTSIVVGSDVATINQVIRFLLCFSRAEEGYCSRYVLPTLPDTFMKGIFVQGLILGKIGEKSISVNQVSSNLYPSTHIEINGKNPKVKQTMVIQHRQRRETTLIQELSSFWNGSPYSSPATELFPQQVKEVAGFVSRFLSELALLKPDRRFARLLLFRRTLHAKSISLITYLQSIRLKPEKEMTGLLKVLKDTLRMDEAEFLIVQITAEKIRPGVLAIIRSY